MMLRVWMAAKTGQADPLLELLEQNLKNLSAADAREPLHVPMDHAA
jgi:hypothetical protein